MVCAVQLWLVLFLHYIHLDWVFAFGVLLFVFVVGGFHGSSLSALMVFHLSTVLENGSS